MHKLSTSTFWLRLLMGVLIFGVAACSSSPLRPGGGDVVESSTSSSDPSGAAGTPTQTSGSVESLRRPAVEVATVPTPKLDSGTQALYDRALGFMQSGQLESAEVLLLEVSESQPELAGPWVNLGLLEAQRGNHDAASDAFTMALQANPKNCTALTSFGVHKRRQGDFTGAESLYLRCLKANPGYADAYLNLGVLYELYLGRFSEALAAYNDYQVMVSQPDQRVAGWVIDLERRVAAIAKR